MSTPCDERIQPSIVIDHCDSEFLALFFCHFVIRVNRFTCLGTICPVSITVHRWRSAFTRSIESTKNERFWRCIEKKILFRESRSEIRGAATRCAAHRMANARSGLGAGKLGMFSMVSSSDTRTGGQAVAEVALSVFATHFVASSPPRHGDAWLLICLRFRRRR